VSTPIDVRARRLTALDSLIRGLEIRHDAAELAKVREIRDRILRGVPPKKGRLVIRYRVNGKVPSGRLGKLPMLAPIA